MHFDSESLKGSVFSRTVVSMVMPNNAVDTAGVEDTSGWNKQLHTSDDYALSVALAADDSVYVVGAGSNLLGASGRDWHNRKFTPAGAQSK